MPNAYITNQRPATYGHAMSLLVEMLVSAGWTYKGSGDGLSTFSNTTKIFTGTGTGAGGWSNAQAWARVQDPAGVREFIFQQNELGSVKIRYSANSQFVGTGNGAVSATVPPTATDERYVRGNSSTYSAWFHSNTTTGAYGTAINGSFGVNGSATYMGAAMSASPYGWWFSSQRMDGDKGRGASMLYDPVLSAPEDTDPYVLHVGSTLQTTNQGAFACATVGATTSGSFGREGGLAATWTVAVPALAVDGSWAHMDTSRTQFLYVQPACWAANLTGQNITSVAQAGLAPNPFNGKHEALPIAWVRGSQAASIPGLKGWSTMMRWTGIGGMNGTTVLPRYTLLDTLDGKNWICVGSVWLPWNGTTVPLG